MTFNWGLPWKTWLIALVFLGAGVYLWNREHRLRLSAGQQAEAAQLQFRGQIVAEQEGKKDLQANRDKLLAENVEIKQAYEAALRAAPGAQTVGAARLDTGPLAVHTPASVGPAADSKSAGGAGQSRVPPSSTASQVPSALPPGGPVVSTACAVWADQHISVEVDALELKTKLGNALVLGTAAVYVDDPVRALLARGSFRSTFSLAEELARPPPPRWGAGALGICGGGGCGPGVVVAPPPVTLPLVGWRVESLLGAAAPPGAGLSALGAAWVRW